MNTDYLFSVELADSTNVLHTKVDVLAMSCALYRLQGSTDCGDIKHKSLTFVVDEILNYMIDEDHVMAKNIRDYYAGKWLLKMMMNRTPLSKFRLDLMTFITNYSDGNYVYPQKYLGMVYRLPYFYHYDLELDELCSKYNTRIRYNVSDLHAQPSSIAIDSKYAEYIYDTELQLAFVKVLDPKKKNKDVLEFIFVDRNNCIFILEMEKRNNFLKFFENYIRNRRMIRCTGTYRLKNRDGNEFYHSRDWDFLG